MCGPLPIRAWWKVGAEEIMLKWVIRTLSILGERSHDLALVDGNVM